MAGVLTKGTTARRALVWMYGDKPVVKPERVVCGKPHRVVRGRGVWPSWVDVLRALPAGRKPCRVTELRRAGPWWHQFGGWLERLVARGMVERVGVGVVRRSLKPCPAYRDAGKWGRRRIDARPVAVAKIRENLPDMGGWPNGMGNSLLEFIPGPRSPLYGVLPAGPVQVDLSDVLRTPGARAAGQRMARELKAKKDPGL